MKKLLRVQEVRNTLGIGINQTRRLIQRDDFPKIKIGRSYRIPEDELEKWVRKSMGKEYKI